MEVLIKNVRVVDCSQDFIGDVYIRKGKIAQIGRDLKGDCQIIEGKGLVLLPSLIDLHAHFRDPGLTYKEDILSGCLASVRGGYTAVNLMANTKPVCSSMEVVEYVLEKAEEIGLVDIHQSVSITKDFNGKDTNHLDELKNTVKIITDDGKGVNSDKVMLEAMTKAAGKGLIVMSHAEVEDITPIDSRLSENLMTFRDICLAKYTGCHLHVAHVSTIEAMEGIIDAKKQGANITCEVTPHHIALSEIDYKVNPPIRGKKDVEFLIKSIKDGFVDCISTDHAPHSKEDKEKGTPGISGIETSFSVCFTKLVKEGHINLNRLSEIMSKNPSKILGLNKGEVKIGYDGDLVLVDTEKKINVSSEDFASKGKNTPFDGMEFYGDIIITLKDGKIVYSKEGLKYGSSICKEQGM